MVSVRVQKIHGVLVKHVPVRTQSVVRSFDVFAMTLVTQMLF